MIRVREIIHVSAVRAGLHPAQLLARDHRQLISRARSRAMFLARRLRPEMSYPAIGREFDGRDHTNVISAERRVQARLDGGDNQERAEIGGSLLLLGLPDDLADAIRAAGAMRDRDRRLGALRRRRVALQHELRAVERQLLAQLEPFIR